VATNYRPADDDTLALAREIIEAYHPMLEHARIALVFREGDAPTTNGKETLGQASLVTSKMQVIATERFDFFVWLAGDWWHDARDEQRRALLDHELSHCAGEPFAWRMRGHDVEEFTCILERHGAWYRELHNFVKTVEESKFKQALLLSENVAALAGLVGTIERASPNGKGGIDSITLSTDERSATLTSDTARRAAALDATETA